MSAFSYHSNYPWSGYLETPEIYKPVLEACLVTEIIRRNRHIPLDQAYLDWKQCQELLRQNRHFRLLLLEAWESSNFSSIIESSLLRGTSDVPGTYNYYGTTHTIVHGDATTYNSCNFVLGDTNKILESLCKRDYNAIHKETYARRVGTTGDWFLQSVSFNSWVHDSQIRTLYLNDYVYPLDVICACCAGLVLLDPDTRTLRLIHSTAQEFFNRVQKTKFPNADLFITKSLMTYLCHITFTSEKKPLMQGFIHQNSLKAYILNHFLKHLQAAEQDLFPNLQAVEQNLPQLRRAITWMMNQMISSYPFHPWGTPYQATIFRLWKIEHSYEALVHAVTFDLPALLSVLLESGVETNTIVGTQRYTPLTIAAWCGASRCVELLLARKDVIADWQTEGKMTPLSLAIMGQNQTIVTTLVARVDIDANKPVMEGITPLMLAAIRYDRSILQLLLDLPYIDVNNVKDTSNGLTALLYAISNWHTKAASAILEHGGFNKAANVTEEHSETGNIIRRTPLTFAIEFGTTSIIPGLLQSERYPIGYRYEGRTLLSFAAQHGVAWLARELIEVEVDTIDLPDDFGRTPLSYSTNAEVSELLFAAGSIRMNLPDSDGRTPLSHAVGRGWSSGTGVGLDADITDRLVTVILERGSIDVNSRDNRGRTPLSYASTPSCVQMLLDHGADINSLDDDGRSPISWAVEGGYLDVVNFMLTLENIQVNLVDRTGRTALSYAATNKVLVCNILSELLENGAIPELDTGLAITRREDIVVKGQPWKRDPEIEELEIDRLDIDGYTRLLKAAMGLRELEEVLDLVLRGANPNARDPFGRTPLSHLAENCTTTWGWTVREHITLMHLLLEKGADINALDNDGFTALDYANIEEIMLFLMMRGGVTGEVSEDRS